MTDKLQRLQKCLSGRYALEREVGRGGMATVYLAQDVRHQRQVAVKVLRPDLTPGDYHPDRFLREIRFVAGLTHPHILPLHDSGECRGTPYYVMPFVEGETLRDRLRRDGRLPVVTAVRLAIAVAAALDYAHRRDVLHRDIKPENILLHEGQPLLSDFGIARAISACCDGLTQVGLALGTPAYMSPEQATGEEELDGRSDVYSLACVLFELLAGEVPFPGASARQVMARQVVAAAPSVRGARPEVSVDLDAVLARALAKDPAHRYSSAADFARALEASLTGASLITRGALATAPGPAVAVLPFENQSSARDDEYFADGMTDELITALTKVGGLSVASRTSVFAFKDDRRDVRSLAASLGVAFVLSGAVRRAGARLRVTVQLSDGGSGRVLWADRYDRSAEDVFAVQDEIARAAVATLRRLLVRDLEEVVPRRYTENLRAYHHYLRGRYYWNRRSRGDVAGAIRHFEQAIAEDPSYALAYAGLADAYALQLDYESVAVGEGMSRAREEAKRALALDDSLAQAHTSLAWVTFIHDWRWDDAESEFRRAIELNPAYATAYQWYAWLLIARGREEEALGAARTACDLDPGSVPTRRALGWVLVYAREYRAAADQLRRAIAMAPDAQETYRILGYAHLHAGRDAEAAAALEEALRLSERGAYDVAALGYLHARHGRMREARALLEELENRARDRYVSPVAFAMLFAGMADADEAFRWLERAREERRGWLVYLRVDPMLDPVREDPRFADLVKRMGL